MKAVAAHIDRRGRGQHRLALGMNHNIKRSQSKHQTTPQHIHFPYIARTHRIGTQFPLVGKLKDRK